MELPINVDAFSLMGSVLEEEGGNALLDLECLGIHQLGWLPQYLSDAPYHLWSGYMFLLWEYSGLPACGKAGASCKWRRHGDTTPGARCCKGVSGAG